MKHNTTPNLALLAGILGVSGLTAVHSADVDVVATQLAPNATYGLDTLAGDTTWTADNTYILTDRVYVPDGVTLTIEPGTRIYGTFDDQGTTGENETDDDTVGAIIVARGGRIEACGKAGAPIIFDAIQNLEAERGMDLPYDPDAVAGPALGYSDKAKWGGIIVLGNASISLVDAAQQPVRNDIIEGFTPAAATDADSDGFSDILEYGYDAAFPQDAADDSGILKYISIRHGGFNFSADNEINGLTLGGVGSGTEISHIEVVANNDDGIEFFGGTVNTSHCVVAFCGDDCFDIDQGHSGTHQFWLAIQNPNDGDNLGEWDGVDTNVNGQSSKTDANVTASNPQIWNATLIGPGANAFTNSNTAKDNGLFLDDSFKGALRNSIIHDSVNFLASFSSDGAFGATGAFANNTIGDFGRYTSASTDVLNNAQANFYLSLGFPNNGNTAAGTAPGFTTYSRNGAGELTVLDPRPVTPNTTVSAGAPVAADYRGAFDGAGNWAAEWTWLGEQGYFGDVSIVDVVAEQTGPNATYGLDTLLTDQCWTADKVYVLTDRVYVPDGVTLTIEEGTRVYGTFDDQGTTGENETDDDTVGAIIVARGGRIEALGSECAPIVFDAIQNLEAELGMDLPYDPDAIIGPALGYTDKAKWGGIIVLGNASISLVDAAQQPVRNDIIEGFTPAAATDADSDGFSDILEYGYDAAFPQDDADDSGILKYISIRHGGFNFSADNEINGLTLGGVGSGTEIHHVEVYANNDDGIEFFGGTVNTSHCVVAYCGDDCFDIDQGHSGTHQFWLAIQNPNDGDNLGEWDGVDTNVNGQSSKTDANVTASNPQIWNATLIGPGANAFINSNTAKDNGLFLDDSFKGALRNSIIHDSVNFLASFSSDGAFGATGAFANNTIGDFGRYTSADADVLNNAQANFYLSLGFPNNGNTAAGTSPDFTVYSRDGGSVLQGLDPRPVTPNTTVSAGAPVTADYRGAFNGSNWAACWTKLWSTGELLVDSDGDSFYDNVTPGSGLVADDDDDNDGLSDAKEAEAGTNPIVADDPALVEFINGLASEDELISIGYSAASIDTGTGDAIITLDLVESDDLGAWSFNQSFNVGLPSGTKFYRFEDN